MTIPLIVPDASVILKWIFRSPDEGHRDNAMDLLNSWLQGKIEILLPRLWVFEIGNVLGLKAPQLAQEIMDTFIGYRFPEHETTTELCRETLKLMRMYGVTFYDAVYHAVAFLREGMLLTTDKVYYRKTVKAGHVLMLEDFQ